MCDTTDAGIVYHVPLEQLSAFRDRPVVVRAREPQQLVRLIEDIAPTELRLIQLLGPPERADALLRWQAGLPVDLLVEDCQRSAGFLYALAGLREDHPVRVSLPVEAGFDKLARVAIALGFSVKLVVTQPCAERLTELATLLQHYLRNPTVGAPVEFFHSLLGALFHHQALDLWQIQEEDPEQSRWVNEQGQVSLPGRLAAEPTGISLAALQQRLEEHNAECLNCPFQAACGGFFKWPDAHYACDGIRQLLGAMEQAVTELSNDLAGYPGASPTEQL